jgi:UDP-glucose 4-epimerase
VTRVLITGASTPVGRALFDALAADPSVERVLAVLPPGTRPFEEAHESDRLGWVTADLTRERDVRSLLFGAARRDETNVIVHLAAHRSARDVGPRIRAQNVKSVRLLVELAERHPTIRRFVLRSNSDVYRIRASEPTLVPEDHALEFSSRAPQWVRDRVEADLSTCSRMGMSPLEIVVVRAAECLAPASGSQLWDYLSSPVCFAPLGFDPMINVMSVFDQVAVLRRAIFASEQGVFNAPGKDTLPLSMIIRKAGRIRVPAPGPLLSPLYGLRALADNRDFRYDLNYARFHFGGILDGTRAARVLGYVPKESVRWSGLFREEDRVRVAGGTLHEIRPRRRTALGAHRARSRITARERRS